MIFPKSINFIEFPSILWPSNVLVYMYHIFICSTVVEHLGCLSILAVVNNAAMNIGCMYFFKLASLFSSDIYPAVKFLDRVLLFFIFEEPPLCFHSGCTRL